MNKGAIRNFQGYGSRWICTVIITIVLIDDGSIYLNPQDREVVGSYYLILAEYCFDLLSLVYH
jgi:hypothetical protein